MPSHSPPATEPDILNGEPEKQSSSNLTDEEKKIIETQTQGPDRKISLFSLLRYANRTETCIMLVALLASIVSGAVLPLMTLVYGNFAQSFTSFAVDDDAKHRFQDQINTLTLYFVYLGIASLVTVYVATVGFAYTGEKITQRIREEYLRAIFRQNIAFFDFLGAGEVTTRITSDMNLVRDGVGEKIALFVNGISMFVAAIVVGFVRSWKLSLIMLSATVALVLMIAINGRNMRVNQVQSVNEYAVAGSIAEEVLSSARNVAASGTQTQLASKYRGYLTKASKFDFRSKFFLSSMIAAIQMIMNLQYSLAFWQGDRFIRSGEVNVGQILTVVMASMISGISIGQNLPHLQAFVQAVAAGTKILNTIERESPIDPETDSGEKPEQIIGDIEFRNVKHIYPSRPDTTVLDDFTLKVPAGKMLALVGASGSGKSTIFGLLERFYLPMSGQIFLDGNDISKLNLKWLRRNITMVSQEPVLFSNTVYESIAHGLVGTEYEDAKEEVKRELIEQAAKTANAYDFIMDLPDKFQTRVGERGNLLSGGQKQRIAIARAVVSNPRVLLLDEATASLDTRSEVAVQKALDRASEGRTTIVIAHRLSTIRHADMIVVMAKGKIVEQGTHDELLSKQAVYHSLVQAQEISSRILPEDIGGEEKNDNIAEEEKLNLIRTTTTKSAKGPIHAKKASEEKEYSTWELAKFSWQMNQKEHLIMIVGFLACIGGGTNASIQAIFLGNSITGLVAPEMTTGKHNISFWCLMFLMLGIVIGLFYYLQGMTLAKASAKLIATARERAFGAILRQDIEFFDSDAVTSGSLASFLSTEANRLAGISGAVLGTILAACAAIVAAIIVGLIFGWKLALVCTATMPLLLGCGYFRFHSLNRMEKRHKESTAASSFACEACASIRTVASLGLETHLLRTYHAQLTAQAAGTMRFTHVSAVLLALSQGLSLFIFALLFWYGGKLMLGTEYTVVQFFVVFSAMINGAQQGGAIFSFAPDMGQARAAAALLKRTVDRVPRIDHWRTDGRRVPESGLQGRIALDNVTFTYPGRPGHPVLKGVSLAAEPGQFIALVGASGSGKSTVMALLERFYDADSGSITVDGVELRDYNLQDYRGQLALVSQETTLYTGTVWENVVGGREDVGEAEVERACRDANVYEFIMSLPDGFSTLVGAKGALLSGGQRQRIAIARALLRNPRILLLDEATSSLDSTSERIVQTALDAASKGRTTVAVAHRLSTIQHADVIFVFDKGRVVERGRHEELMRRRGVYWELARLQDMGAPQ